MLPRLPASYSGFPQIARYSCLRAVRIQRSHTGLLLTVVCTCVLLFAFNRPIRTLMVPTSAIPVNSYSASAPVSTSARVRYDKLLFFGKSEYHTQCLQIPKGLLRFLFWSLYCVFNTTCYVTRT